MINKAQFLHGSNEVNYQNFKCKTCGNEEKFGVIICLKCADDIAGLKDKIHRRNMQIAELKKGINKKTNLHLAIVLKGKITAEEFQEGFKAGTF